MNILEVIGESMGVHQDDHYKDLKIKLQNVSDIPPTAESVTSQELEYLIEQGARHGSLDETKEQLLSSVLAFTEVLVKEIMIPRTQVVALEESAVR